ncbi:MAG: FG-GAP-like repeat-containing protein [Planctomycetota bacterium]|jgi:hypothetical protein
MHRTVLPTLTLLLLSLPLTAQKVVATVEGSAVNDLFGTSVAGIGDINNDGIQDYIVGARGLPPVTTTKGFAQVYSGATDTVLFTVTGAASGDMFGFCVAGAGDVNKDGTPDFIVGAIQNTFGSRKGYAQVFSGTNAVQIHKVSGSGTGDLLGWAVAGVGDLNKDGYADFAVGAPGAVTVNSSSQNVASGKVIVYSGKDAAVLKTLKSEAAGDRFGEAIAGIADTNADTFDDFIIGLPGSDSKATDAGQCLLVSGKDYTTLQTVDGTAAGDGFGFSAASLGDVSSDSKPDFAVGCDYGNYVRIVSGTNGSTIRTHTGTGSSDGLGQSVAGPGDLDGDGKPDVLVGAHYPPPFGALIGSGYARAYSGTTGATLFTVNGAANGDYFGTAVAGIGDRNKDGVPEFIVGAHGAVNSSSKASGIAKVYSVVGDTLTRDSVTSISLFAGGTQILSLNCGATRGGGKAYLVLGSISGSTPGFSFPFSNLVMPIKYDIYTGSLLAAINQIPLLGALGLMDSQGRATARFVIPAGFPSALASLTVTHAFIIADPVVQVPTFVSNTVTVTLDL